MDPKNSGSPTGALELIISDISDIAIGAINTFHKSMSSLIVMQGIDWTTMFLFFWILFGLIVYSVANILLIVQKKRQTLNQSKSGKSSSSDSVSNDLQKRTVVLDNSENRSKLNSANGPDKYCVDWVNKIIKWFYSQNDATIDSIVNIWINALNNQVNKNKKLSNEVSLRRNSFLNSFKQI